MAYTPSTVNDCEVVTEMSQRISGKVQSVRADEAYDTEAFHQIIHEWGAQALIPPARTSKAQHELTNPPKNLKPYLAQRDAIIQDIRRFPTFDEGLKA